MRVFFFLTLLGNFLQRNYYTFCSQINKVYLYVFQRRFKFFLAQKKLKLVALHALKHSRLKKGRRTVSMILAIFVGNKKMRMFLN